MINHNSVQVSIIKEAIDDVDLDLQEADIQYLKLHISTPIKNSRVLQQHLNTHFFKEYHLVDRNVPFLVAIRDVYDLYDQNGYVGATQAIDDIINEWEPKKIKLIESQ